MNRSVLFLLLLVGFFVIGFIAAISEQHKTHEEAIDDEDDECIDDQVTIVVSQEVPSIFDNFSSKK